MLQTMSSVIRRNSAALRARVLPWYTSGSAGHRPRTRGHRTLHMGHSAGFGAVFSLIVDGKGTPNHGSDHAASQILS